MPQHTRQYQLDTCFTALRHRYDIGRHTGHAGKTCDCRGLNSGYYTQSPSLLQALCRELGNTHKAAKGDRQSWHPASEPKDLTIGWPSLQHNFACKRLFCRGGARHTYHDCGFVGATVVVHSHHDLGGLMMHEGLVVGRHRGEAKFPH